MSEEERERLKQIRERRHAATLPANQRGLLHTASWVDIDFLLSLLDSRLAASVTVSTLIGYEAGQKDGKDAMRDACVEKVKSIQAEHGRTPVDSEDYEYDQAVAWALCRVTRELESLTLDQVEQEKQP